MLTARPFLLTFRRAWITIIPEEGGTAVYAVLHALLSDHKGEIVFSCYGIWHILYMAMIFGLIALVIVLLRHKDAKIKRKAVDIAICIAFGLYVADFFLMPFAYGAIDLEKLPYHFCTAMCLLCFLSRYNGWLGRFRSQFTVLGLVSNLIYVIYPAGVGWYQIHPASYRVIQTLLFHGAMTAYGLFALVFEDVRLERKAWKKELMVILCMTAWACLGNFLYNGDYDGVKRFFNWSFVVRDPFYLLPESVSPYVMPFVIVLIYFIASRTVVLGCSVCKKMPIRRF